jgi:membrane protease YdiL (CAAX protease family)
MQVPAAFFALLLVAVSIPITAGLLFFIGQLQKATPIMPYEPRRPAPWNGIDVLMFLGIMFLAEIACLKIGMLGSGTHFPDEGAVPDSQQQYLLVTAHFVGSLMTLILGAAMLSVRVAATPIDLGWNAARIPYDLKCGAIAFAVIAPVVFAVQLLLTKVVPYEHPVIELIQQRPSGMMLVVLTVSTVLIAPLFEEFLFRVLLQGWLEKVEESWLSRLREDQDKPSDEVSATIENTVNIDPNPADGGVSKVSLFGITPGFLPIAISSLIFSLMHYGQGPAMVPLFVFAVVLGFLYRQTHRLLPSFTVHFLLNAVSMAMLLAQPGGGGAG